MTDNNVTRITKRAGATAAAAVSFSQLKLNIEAILFAAESQIEASEIRNILGEVAIGDVRLALRDLNTDYQERAFFIYENNNKYQLRTKAEYSPLLKKLHQSKPKSLSRSSLETLAIIAYKQPVTRAEVNIIRGLDSSSIISALKEKELIEVAGIRKEVGSPMEYRTSKQFLEIFSLNSLQELPRLRSLQMDKRDEQKISQALESLHSQGAEPEKIVDTDLAFLGE